MLGGFMIKRIIFDLDNTISLINQYKITDSTKKLLNSLKKDFKIEIITGKKQNLFKLMELLNKVENQILIETQLKNQSEILVEKNEKVNNLLNDFAKILSGSEKYTTYI